MSNLSIFLDYQILDHLFRIGNKTYEGKRKHELALTELRKKAEKQMVNIWMSEITKVEMIHGKNNPRINEAKRCLARTNDQKKTAIAKTMNIKWLTYPCSKFDDNYSLFDVSARFSGPEWNEANTFEKWLLNIKGVSPGDARQVVSCIYGSDVNALDKKPVIKWFLTEDSALRSALINVKSKSKISELSQMKISSVSGFVNK
ncbi:hypothetical protein ES708_15385 [subsurface metagenome]